MIKDRETVHTNSERKKTHCMRTELRANGVHICGYVNVPEKKSSPVITKQHGVVIETFAPKTFERALEQTRDVELTVDHGDTVYASTAAGTLTLYEDCVGLYADALISDKEIIRAAQNRKIRGWSIGFSALEDVLEQDVRFAYPLRIVSSIILNHVSLIIEKCPIYNATSVEILDKSTRQQAICLVEANSDYRHRAAVAYKKQ